MAKVKKKATKETEVKTEVKVKEKEKETEKVDGGLWAEAVGATGAVVLMLYQAVLTITLIVATVWLLRKMCSEGEEAGNCCEWVIPLVIVLGALGGQIRCLRSLSVYVGNQELIKSWIPRYLMSPLVGSMLALVFFLLVRGGLLMMSTDMKEPSAVGLAGASALVGMFSDEAAVKFKAIAGAIFSNDKKGKNPATEKDGDGQ